MFTQRKALVGLIALFAFLTTSASGATAILAEDDTHWSGTVPTSVISDDATQYLAECTTPDCGDDTHW